MNNFNVLSSFYGWQFFFLVMLYKTCWLNSFCINFKPWLIKQKADLGLNNSGWTEMRGFLYSWILKVENVLKEYENCSDWSTCFKSYQPFEWGCGGIIGNQSHNNGSQRPFGLFVFNVVVTQTHSVTQIRSIAVTGI